MAVRSRTRTLRADREADMKRPLGLSREQVLAFYGVPLVPSERGCLRPSKLARPQANGYWHLHFDGRTQTLHRLIAELDGDLGGRQVRHSCGNKWCVNRNHLVTGSRLDNMRDQYVLGERVMNERHPNCRLSRQDARFIRDADRSISTRSLAERFGLSPSYVNEIRAGSRRKFLEIA